MQHTNTVWKLAMPIALASIFISCKKENYFLNNQRKETTQNRKLQVESLLTSVERRLESSTKTEIFKQLEVSYDSGRVGGIVNFAWSDGSVRSIRHYEYDAIGRLTSTTVKDEGRIRYVYNQSGQIIEARFVHQSDASKNYRLVYTRSSNDSTITEDKFDNFSFGVERIMYKFYPDGTFKSIEKFDPQNEMKLKGKLIMQNSYEPKQLIAWKQTVSKFPEPTQPMPVITMLATKIEMFADSGYCCDDVIVDGRIITAENVDLNTFGQTIRIRIATTNNRAMSAPVPGEMITMGYTKVQW